ncbi:MAG: response regulator transcription factor [Gemmatimonadaceae bacterium]|nr:response regulator transcription factor [Gemmatimonadaceae bacterium]
MKPIRLFCADDNELLADALREGMNALPDVEWVGWSANAVDLTSRLRETGANVLLLDLEMPLVDPIEALADLSASLPGVHTLVLSGFVDRNLFDRAMEAGATGYLSKLAEGQAIIDGVRKVHAGQFVTDIGPWGPQGGHTWPGVHG